MNKHEESKSQEANGAKTDFNGKDQASLDQLSIVNEFFKKGWRRRDDRIH